MTLILCVDDRGGLSFNGRRQSQDPETALERADRLVLYRWGRRYPADRRLDLPPKGWRLEGRTEFPGRSHDMITKEIYIK